MTLKLRALCLQDLALNTTWGTHAQRSQGTAKEFSFSWAGHVMQTTTKKKLLHVSTPYRCLIPNLKPGCKRDLSQASRTASATSSSPPGYQGRETPPRKQLDVRTSSSIERPWQAPDYAKHQNNLCAYTLTALTPSLQSSSPNKTQSSDLTHQTEDRESMGILCRKLHLDEDLPVQTILNS